MWDYIQDDLTSIVLISKKDHSLTIKIHGFKEHEIAESFAHYAMSLLNFDYNATGYSMPSKRLH